MITSGVIDVGDGFRIMFEPHKVRSPMLFTRFHITKIFVTKFI